MLDAVEGSAEADVAPPGDDHESTAANPVPDDLGLLEPSPALPYVWVNGEFVRNAAYVAPRPKTPTLEPEPLRCRNPCRSCLRAQ